MGRLGERREKGEWVEEVDGGKGGNLGVVGEDRREESDGDFPMYLPPTTFNEDADEDEVSSGGCGAAATTDAATLAAAAAAAAVLIAAAFVSAAFVARAVVAGRTAAAAIAAVEKGGVAEGEDRRRELQSSRSRRRM